jgi:hypothetical protein
LCSGSAVNNSIQFNPAFIFLLRARASDQIQSQQKHKQQKCDNTGQNKQKPTKEAIKTKKGESV